VSDGGIHERVNERANRGWLERFRGNGGRYIYDRLNILLSGRLTRLEDTKDPGR